MRVIATGIKARDLNVELSKLSVIIASNGAGKSTIADCIRLAFLGHCPSLGRRTADTALLLRGREMRAGLVLDDGRTIDFTLKANGKGHTTETSCSWLEETGDAARALISRLVGKEEKDADEVLDVRTLLTAPVEQRAARIQALVAGSARTPQELFRAVSRYTIGRLAGVADDRIPAKASELRPSIEANDAGKAQYKLLVESVDTQRAKLAEGIAVAVSWANEQKRAADNLLKQQRAAKIELEQRLQGLPTSNPARLAELDAQRTQLDRDIGATKERSAASAKQADVLAEAQGEYAHAVEHVETTRSAWEQAEKRRPEIRAKKDLLAGVIKALDEMQPPPAPPAIATAQELVVLRSRLSSVQAELDAVLVPQSPSYQTVTAIEERARATDDEADRLPSPEPQADLTSRVAKWEATLDALIEQRNQADKHPLRQLVAEIATFKASWRALNVRRSGATRLVDDFCDKQHAGLVAAMGQDNSAALSLKIDEAEKQLASARAVEQSQDTGSEFHREVLRTQASELRALAGIERETITQAHVNARKHYDAQVQSYRTQRDNCVRQIEELEAVEAKRHGAIEAEYQGKRDAKEAERRALTKKRDELDALITTLVTNDETAGHAFREATAAAEAASQRLEDLGAGPVAEATEGPDRDSQRALIVEEIAQLQGAAATISQLEAILTDIAREEARSVVFKALEAACKRVRDEELDSAGGPIAALMDQMLLAAGLTYKSIVRSDMVGWTKPAPLDDPDQTRRTVDVKALSNGEYQFFLALLTAADMILRGAELKPLLIEAGEMDGTLFRATCAGIGAVANRLSMALICRWSEEQIPAGWTRVQLDSGQARAAA